MPSAFMPWMLQYPHLHQQHDALGERILAQWVVLFLQAGSESGGEGLVDGGTEGAEESFHQFEGGGFGFPIHQFDEHFAL